MNIKDNQRLQETLQRIDAVFAAMLREQELNQISVTDLCKKTEIERSTFYANYEDIDALATAYCRKVELQMCEHKTDDFAWIFAYIQEHKEAFETNYKIGISGKGENYQETFFRNGVHGIVKLWFDNGCIENPQTMGAIVNREHLKLFGYDKSKI